MPCRRRRSHLTNPPCGDLMPRFVATAGAAILSLACATASLADESLRVGFARDVVPALTKAGCNAGACHGSFQGRGGFKLSLLGFDAQADYQSIVRDARGRRVFPSSPEESLILRKPTQRLPHGGGLRLTAADPAYGILHAWVEQGMPVPQAGLRVTRLDVSPTELVMQPGDQKQLTVIATWSDGQARDVTAWAQYDVRQQEIAETSTAGAVTAAAAGRTAVTVRYSGSVVAVPVTVPFAAAAQPVDFAPQNF